MRELEAQMPHMKVEDLSLRCQRGPGASLTGDLDMQNTEGLIMQTLSSESRSTNRLSLSASLSHRLRSC